MGELGDLAFQVVAEVDPSRRRQKRASSRRGKVEMQFFFELSFSAILQNLRAIETPSKSKPKSARMYQLGPI
jgi:hypothetical protein